MINAPILTEFPVDACAPNGGNVSGIAVLEVIRVQDVVSMPSCACKSGGTVTGSIYLTAGAVAARYEFDQDALGWKMDEVDTPHLSVYRHSLQGFRSKVSPELMTALMRLRMGRFILVLTDFNGFRWIIGHTSTPATFLGSTEISPERTGTNGGFFRFLCTMLRGACAFIGQVVAIDCGSVQNDDFNSFGFTFNGTGQIIGLPAPTIAVGSVVGSITSYDDGTIQQLTGGTYADTITETGGAYALDGGPVTLAAGTYRVRMPMSIQLIDGTNCAFTIDYILSYSFGCGDVTNADFNGLSLQYNGSGEFTGFPVPTIVPSGLVASINTFDDGTIQQITGGTYADGITETAGIYEPDGGPVPLLNGTYRIRVPMGITLTTGQTCAFTLEYFFNVSSIFDPTVFDSSIFE